MKKYLTFGIIAVTIIFIFFIPFNHFQYEKGLIIYNMDKTIIFFLPIKELNDNLSVGDLIKRNNLNGFQFKRTLQNYHQFFKPNYKVLTSNPGEGYGLSVRIWYIGKCTGSFSYNESIINNIISKFQYQKFSIELSDKVFLKFKYIKKDNIDYVNLKEIK